MKKNILILIFVFAVFSFAYEAYAASCGDYGGACTGDSTGALAIPPSMDSARGQCNYPVRETRGDQSCMNIASNQRCWVRGTVSCSSPSTCTTSGCVAGSSQPAPYCGDRSCNNGETCSTCSGDCGTCPVSSTPSSGGGGGTTSGGSTTAPRVNGYLVDACYEPSGGGVDCGRKQDAANAYCASVNGAGSRATSYTEGGGANTIGGTIYLPSGRVCSGCGAYFKSITCSTSGGSSVTPISGDVSNEVAEHGTASVTCPSSGTITQLQAYYYCPGDTRSIECPLRRTGDSGLISGGAGQNSASYRFDNTACTDPCGGISKRGKLIAKCTAPLPTSSISASKTTITDGDFIAISWSSSNANVCYASSSPATSTWEGTKSTSGSETKAPPVTRIYTITCSGTGGSSSSSVTVNVNPLPKPSVSISKSRDITLGQSFTLTWSSTNANSCTASDGWFGSKATSGSEQVTPALAGTRTYTLSCTGFGGTASQYVNVIVTDPCAGVTCTNPSASCDGNTRVRYTTSATCSVVSGRAQCNNGQQERTDCAASGQVCRNGGCVTPPSFSSFLASPLSLIAGNTQGPDFSTKVSWSSNADNCKLIYPPVFSNFEYDAGTSGDIYIGPFPTAGSYTFTMRCTKNSINADRQFTMTIGNPPAVNGACGSSNAAKTASKPATNLCSSGTSSAVSGSGPWTWTCSGANGGSTASCSAPTFSAPTAATPTIVSGECKQGSRITVRCTATDADNDLKNIRIWAGDCDASNCKDTRSWAGTRRFFITYYDGTGGGSRDVSGTTASHEVTFTVDQATNSGIAVTCQASDRRNLDSSFSDRYPICAVGACTTPPSFSIKGVSVPAGQQSKIEIKFDSALKDGIDGTIEVHAKTLSAPDTDSSYVSLVKDTAQSSGTSYTYYLDTSRLVAGNPIRQGGTMVARIKGTDSFKCQGSAFHNFEISQPTASLSLGSSKAFQGDSTTYTWSSTNANSCTLDVGKRGGATISTALSTSGSGNIDTKATGIFDYLIACYGPGGSRTASASIEIFPKPSITSFSVAPAKTTTQSGAKISIASQNTQSCKANVFSIAGDIVNTITLQPNENGKAISTPNFGIFFLTADCKGLDGTTPVRSSGVRIAVLPQKPVIDNAVTITSSNPNDVGTITNTEWDAEKVSQVTLQPGQLFFGAFGDYGYDLYRRGRGGYMGNVANQFVNSCDGSKSICTAGQTSCKSASECSIALGDVTGVCVEACTSAGQCRQLSGKWQRCVACPYRPDKTGNFPANYNGPGGARPADNWNTVNVAEGAWIEDPSCSAIGASITVNANPNPIIVNNPVTLTWSSSNVDPNSCIASSTDNTWTASKPAASQSGERVTPTTTGRKTYTLTCAKTQPAVPESVIPSSGLTPIGKYISCSIPAESGCVKNINEPNKEIFNCPQSAKSQRIYFNIKPDVLTNPARLQQRVWVSYSINHGTAIPCVLNSECDSRTYNIDVRPSSPGNRFVIEGLYEVMDEAGSIVQEYQSVGSCEFIFQQQPAQCTTTTQTSAATSTAAAGSAQNYYNTLYAKIDTRSYGTGSVYQDVKSQQMLSCLPPDGCTATGPDTYECPIDAAGKATDVSVLYDNLATTAVTPNAAPDGIYYRIKNQQGIYIQEFAPLCDDYKNGCQKDIIPSQIKVPPGVYADPIKTEMTVETYYQYNGQISGRTTYPAASFVYVGAGSCTVRFKDTLTTQTTTPSSQCLSGVAQVQVNAPPPTTAITSTCPSITQWFNANSISIDVKDERAEKCYYSTLSNDASFIRNEVSRTCNSRLQLSQRDCPNSGADACTVGVYARNAQGTAGKASACTYSIDNTIPTINSLTCRADGKCSGNTCLKGTKLTASMAASDSQSGITTTGIFAYFNNDITGTLTPLESSGTGTTTTQYTANNLGDIGFMPAASDKAGNSYIASELDPTLSNELKTQLATCKYKIVDENSAPVLNFLKVNDVQSFMCAHVQETQQSQFATLTPDYKDPNTGDKVRLKCEGYSDTDFGSPPPSKAITVGGGFGLNGDVTNVNLNDPSAIGSKKYEFRCKVEDDAASPKTRKESNSLTATLYVHKCPGGYLWSSDEPNQQCGPGRCKEDPNIIQCKSEYTVGNYVCYKDSKKAATACIGNAQENPEYEGRACCAAGIGGNDAIYDAFVDIKTY